MRAAILPSASEPLKIVSDHPRPNPGPGEILLRVHVCGVCRTDLHVMDGELAGPKYPLVPGHEIVGTIVSTGPQVSQRRVGERVGVPWLAWTCGQCEYCRSGRENLCPGARFTGYTVDGGYAEYAVADARYCLPLPADYSDVEVAPLLCAGLIGFRAWKQVRGARHLGLYGFGAAAHMVAQVALHHGQTVYAVTRPGDVESQVFARKLGASWAGGSNEMPPRPIDGAIIFAPAGDLVPAALGASAPGATVVCAGIHMSDIPPIPYALLWQERSVRSVANLTREDGEEFLALAPRIPVRISTSAYPLWDAPAAIADLRKGRINGAAVLVVRE